MPEASPDAGHPALTDAGAVDAAEPSAHEAMQALVTRACSFSSCHGGDGAGKARLNFARALAQGKTLSQLLNDVPSCEYPPLPLVKPFEPEQSWLMVKLTAPHDADGKLEFTPDPTWQPMFDPEVPSTCPLTEGSELSFGQLMPISGTVSRALSDDELAIVRRWISLGASSL